MAVICGLGMYLPERSMSAEEIAEASGLPVWVVRDKMGLERKTLPGPDDHTNAMAIWAAQKALADAGLSGADVDVVISINEEWKEYPVWTTGSALAAGVQADRAWAFDINQKCCTFILALELARGIFMTRPEVDVILVAGGYRNGDLIDFTDPNVRFMYDLAAGGGAAVIRRQGEGLKVLSTKMITDSQLAEAVVVPVGGTKTFLTDANRSDFFLRVPNEEEMKGRLSKVSAPNFVRAIQEAMSLAAKTSEEIDYVALLHMKLSAHEAVMEGIGVDTSKSIYLKEYGHIGQLDQILSLKLAREQGMYQKGQTAILAAAGLGYTWGAAVVSWE
ncbi:MAG: 3-oxoacyl-ACP synthase [Myxococcales bacterium]|nr:3-oxoacyl-ACP synthase [Myxococcales bacterium]MCB9641790.1 3-oxoacyl-ACP synthase [Myxococcales bacterium]